MLSRTKQKSAKRFRKIGATDSSQFGAPNAKKFSANASILPCILYFPCTVWSTLPPTSKVVTDQTEVSLTVYKKKMDQQIPANAKKSSAKNFSKQHTFEEFHMKSPNIC